VEDGNLKQISAVLANKRNMDESWEKQRAFLGMDLDVWRLLLAG
jgi:hypothetical protein